MATVSTFRNDSLPQHEVDVAGITKSFAVVNGSAANGDAISVFQVPYGASWRLFGAILRTSATLGASSTIQARLNRGGSYTTLTAATTAGAASKVDGSAQAGIPLDLQGGDILELLVGGANITAGATVTLDLLIANK